ncbi:hypothetical protein [Clostridium minihomine]|uniref:hypothetical protein n=1 Tax=Clostridium minihomine TaxID=2045012 RepID=UPI001FB22D66|nr:hypothetical protein [Clostridium minihomine]
MAQDFNIASEERGTGCFKEAVCIDAMRIYDSCSDKDCLEDLRVYFTPDRQQMINEAATVRIKNIEVITVYLDLEAVPFNKGFYSVDMTFFFDVALDVYCSPTSGPVQVNGISVFNKKVILYGSEGNVKMFSSDCGLDDLEVQPWSCRALPKATVQVAEPVGLSAKVCDCPVHSCDICCRIPDCICRRYGSDFLMDGVNRTVYVTIGIFTIVQIVRNVQMLIPAYDFCIPEKECVATSDDPCELFRRIEFPTDEFFPPKAGDCGCEDRGCRQR